jgi:ribosomal protein L30/L7E
MRLFFALCARKNYVVSYGDSTNAFQNAPAPTHQCYLEIDESYMVWYKRKFGKDIDPRTHVIPLHKAMQGHPESGRLWAEMVNTVLQDELGFKATTHEPCLYKGSINGKEVLVARMVDDYAIGSEDTTAGEVICAAVNKRAATEHLGTGTMTLHGAFTRFNGVDVYQTRDYIKITCETYIERLLLTHGWMDPGTNESDRHDITPISYETAAKLLLLTGPADGTYEHRKLEETFKFSYRQLLGECLYAFVVGRLDIGYAVTLLARMASAPHAEHYTALKKVAKYLRATKHWGIYYWRPAPNEAFPKVDPPKIPNQSDPSLPSFPTPPSDCLTAFVDAAHAADPTTRRSITGLVVMYGGGPIAFKTKQQKAVTTSSTEAELIAAVSAAKVIRYLRSILDDLGLPQESASVMYEDNKAVLDIVNKQIPSERTRHCDIQYFALQEWRARGIVKMAYIPGIINPADQATKAVGPTLHYRHVPRSMGFYPAPL